MEPLESDCFTSKTDIVNVENANCRTPSPLTSSNGSDCNTSATKVVPVAIAERDDVVLGLTGHLIPVSTRPEEGSLSETESSIVSSASTLKIRLNNLPPSSEAVKLADRVAALNQRIRRERDLYLHLQGLGNQIEERDEGELSTTDSSKTVNSTFNRHHHGQVSNARARRRERLNSDSVMLQQHISPDLQLCSASFSSPEPLTLREIHEDWIEGMKQVSSPIEDQYCFQNDPVIDLMQENIATASLPNSSNSQKIEMADGMTSPYRNASKFFNKSSTDQRFRSISSDRENSEPMVTEPSGSHARISNFHFDNADYLEDGFTNCNSSSETKKNHFRATTSSTASSTGVDYPYVTRKRTPMKFGGYRPSSGLIFRNLSSDSESDAPLVPILRKQLCSQKYQLGNRAGLEADEAKELELQDSDTIPRNFSRNSDRITEVRPFSVEKDELLSPVVPADSGHFFENSNHSRKIETHLERQVPGRTGRAPITLNERSRPRHLDSNIENVVKQTTLVDCNADHFHNAQFMEESLSDSFSEDIDTYISMNRTKDKSNENSCEPVQYVSFPERSQKDILPPLDSNSQSLCVSGFSRATETLILREKARPSSHGLDDVNLTISESGTQACGITNHQSLPASVRSHPESMGSPGDLRNQGENHGYNFTDSNVHPKIPPLEIQSHDHSQSHSLSSESRGDETAKSSLDVNALIQALSDVSLKQKNSTKCRNTSMLKLKSPLGYGNRISGSSGPRSSEYTPAAGGSRQSLTSLEVSEAHSIKIPKGKLTVRRQATPLLKSDGQGTRSATKTPEVLIKGVEESKPSSKIKKSSIVISIPLGVPEPELEVDLSRGSSFIPVVAKVNKTNLVCLQHPLKVKSIGKIISPRKYRNTDIRSEITNTLTTRTDVSQSSDGSRKSFRSLKSAQLVTKVHGTKMDGLQSKMDSAKLLAPLSGRRVLEPLNSAPKFKPNLLISMNRKLERRKKIAKDLSDVINSQSTAESERTITAFCSRNYSRKSPRSRPRKTDSRMPCFPKRLETAKGRQALRSTIHDSQVPSGERTPRESFDNVSGTSTRQDHGFLENSIKNQKRLGVSSDKSSVTSGNALYLRSERMSMSSGDYEGKRSWSASPRDEDLTENDNRYDSDDKLDDQQQPVEMNGKMMPEVTDLDAQTIILSHFTTESLARSFRNCVHLNDLQDGREVSLTCGIAKCGEASLRKTELFNRLPNEISGSLTRHGSFGTQITEDSKPTNETPSTIEDLRKNIQQNNDRWIKGFKSDDNLENPIPGFADDKASYTRTPVHNRESQSQNFPSKPAKIFQEIPLLDCDSFQNQLPLPKAVEGTESLCSRSLVSGKIDSVMFDDGCSSSPLYKYGDTRQKSEYDRQSDQLDSQKSSPIQFGANSRQNTFRSIAESTDSTTVLRIDETLDYVLSGQEFDPEMADLRAIESGHSEEQQKVVDTGKENDRPCDIQVISSTAEETIVRKDCPETPVSVHPSYSISDTDEIDRKELDLSTDTNSNPDDDMEVVKALPSIKAKFDSTSNRSFGYLHSRLKLDKGCEQSIENSCHGEDQSTNSLEVDGCSKYPATFNDSEIGVCEKMNSPSGTRSAKSQTLKHHHPDGIISSSVSIKSFSSMSKLNLSGDSKWDATVVTGANIVKKSQDRFPFTISESASRKTSKFKVAADVSLDQLIQDQNTHAERSNSFSTQKPILAKSGDQRTIDTDEQIDRCDQSPVRQLTPFLEEFTNKFSNDSPDNWDARIPFNALNYMSYGCHEEPRTLIPSVKEMVKKLSAKLGYTRTKRSLDPEETKVEILYRNKKCRYESGEGSSSAASLYQSQLLNTSNKFVSNFVRRSNDGSRASSGKTMKPKRNHECISMSMDHSPQKGCDQNDLWIQEFDSDVEFDTQVDYSQMQNDFKKETMPRTSSPVNDRYSMFMARRKFPEIINKADHNERSRTMESSLNCCDDGDNEKINPNKRSALGDRLQSIEVPKMVSESPKTPANSFTDDTNEFQIDTGDNNFEDSTPRNGCCCFRIYQFFVRSKKRRSKIRRRIEVPKNK